jgi:short-subunit dehydrogenase
MPFAAIIGAGPGIGLAVARRFAREGFRVGVVARPGEPLEAFQADLETFAPALCLGADVGDARALQGALETLGAWGGSPEVLVCNASRGLAAQAADLTPEALAADFQVNVASAQASVRWALPSMRARGRGTLLFTGGGLALAPGTGQASLSLGKAALRSLALSLGAELKGEGLHAATVTVCGFVQAGTPFDADFVAETYWELHQEEAAGGRLEVILRPPPLDDDLLIQ